MEQKQDTSIGTDSGETLTQEEQRIADLESNMSWVQLKKFREQQEMIERRTKMRALEIEMQEKYGADRPSIGKKKQRKGDENWVHSSTHQARSVADRKFVENMKNGGQNSDA